MPSRILPVLIGAALAWAACAALTGGIDLRLFGLRLRSTSPDRPLIIAAIVALAYARYYRDDARRDLRSLGARVSAAVAGRQRTAVLLLLSLATVVAGVARGALVAGGSDSYGYVSQADLWLKGDLLVEQPLAAELPWPDAERTVAPLGYRPAAQPGAMAPIYAPGLPVLMAGAKAALGACGPFLIVPLLAGFTVWLTFLLGRQLASAAAGLSAAALIATSPTFVFMTLNPMSDVPVTAFFLAALVAALSPLRSRAVWTGAAVSMAIFIRPNLAPLGAVFLVFLVLRASRDEERFPARARWRTALWFCGGAAPLVAAVALVNTVLFGAPWTSGYGSLDELYAWRHIGQNVIDFSRWVWQTEASVVVLMGAWLAVRRLEPERRRQVGLLGWFAGGVLLSYLFFMPFGVWVYLRFLLPAFPAVIVVAVLGGALLLKRIADDSERAGIAALLLLAVLVLRVDVISERQLLAHWREGLLYSSVSAWIDNELPSQAVVFTVRHSGSIRHDTGRLTMRWEHLPPDWWPRAVETLADRGYRPYVLLLSEEEELFRRRFGLAADQAPGRVIATLGVSEPTARLYDPLGSASAVPASIPPVRSRPCSCFWP